MAIESQVRVFLCEDRTVGRSRYKHEGMHPERECILKSVLKDEGIIVDRSVDVFVSRLRKLLQNAPTLCIASVHGVGYRLKVRAEAD